MKRRFMRISYKLLLIAMLFCSFDARAMPSEEVVSSYTKCIAALWVGSAELRMKGAHDSSDTFSALANKLNREILSTALLEQERKYLESMIDLEFNKYRALRDREQLSYAMHILERNQCNRLRL